MPDFRRSTTIDAPLDRVWSFHTRIDGLTALTPAFVRLEVEDVSHPDGPGDPEDLVAGTVITLSARPFDVGPRQCAAVEILDRDRGPGRAHFTDALREGPLSRWQHTHRFYGDDEETTLLDRVEYELPDAPLPAGGQRAVRPVLDPPFRAGLRMVFAQRHRQTRRLLEDFSERKPDP